MLTHSMSTLCILHLLMHLSSGHVTLPPEEFHNPEIFPQSDFGCWADSRWALPQISSTVKHLAVDHFVVFVLCTFINEDKLKHLYSQAI